MPKPKSLMKGFGRTIETARPTAKRQVLFDPDTTGLALIVSPKGKRTLTVVARNPDGKQVWREIGQPGEMTLEEFRAKARLGVARIKAGDDPFPPEAKPAKPETFNDVADNYLRRHVRKEGQGEPALRSAPEIKRQIDTFFRPIWGELPFADIRRSDVAKALQGIADTRGPVMADRALATLSKLFKMQTPFMPDEWQPPLMVGMRKTKASARAVTRILFDDDRRNYDDLRRVWQAAVQCGSFGAFVRLLLLCGQRRAKVASMRWDDLSEDGVWTIPSEPGEKGNAARLKLPAMALEIIHAQPTIVGNPYVFAARGAGHMSGFGKLKAKLDAMVGDIDPWTLHDLRRTAKSLMGIAGVRPEISERVLGHAIYGVEGTYDRPKYFAEKADALEALAGLVLRIVEGHEGNVIELKARQ